MKFILDKEKYIDTGLITEREHPTLPYVIYNYTPVCQYSKAWDDVTLQCRGLIVHKETGEIIARPFTKFFNYEEHIQEGSILPEIPYEEVPEVYDKRDGSLGILYFTPEGEARIATRGSFTSKQALWATGYLTSKDVNHFFDRDFTYLFEIIHPDNRIVVDYGDRTGLDILAIIDIDTGEEVQIPNHPIWDEIGEKPEMHLFSSVDELKKRNVPNHEGFILFYRKNKLRVKIKFDEYVRLHKIITGLSEIGIWEMLRDGKSINDMLENIPDEMHAWLKDIVQQLTSRFLSIELTCQSITSQAEVHSEDRKERALFIMAQTKGFPGVCFSMLDGKDYKQAIWKMIRPVGSNTFRVDIDK